jgi:hypothetical protein
MMRGSHPETAQHVRRFKSLSFLVPCAAAVVTVNAVCHDTTIDAAACELFGSGDLRSGECRARGHHATIDAGIGYAIAVLLGETIECDRALWSHADLDETLGYQFVHAGENAPHFGDALLNGLLRLQNCIAGHCDLLRNQRPVPAT